jgi:1-deoxyxylulose-5-phosphate synthase
LGSDIIFFYDRFSRIFKSQQVDTFKPSTLYQGTLHEVFQFTHISRPKDEDFKVADRLAEVANARNAPAMQVALARILSKETMTAPIIGATKLHHLDDAIKALEVKLTKEEIAKLEEPYKPHPVLGFS